MKDRATSGHRRDPAGRQAVSRTIHPGEPLAEAERRLGQRLEQTSALQQERHRIVKLLAEKDVERGRVVTLFRHGLTSLDATDKQIAAMNQEAASLRILVDSDTAQSDVTRAL